VFLDRRASTPSSAGCELSRFLLVDQRVGCAIHEGTRDARRVWRGPSVGRAANLCLVNRVWLKARAIAAAGRSGVWKESNGEVMGITATLAFFTILSDHFGFDRLFRSLPGAHRPVRCSRSVASRHPARQPARVGVHSRRRLRALSRSSSRGVMRRAEGSRHLELLPMSDHVHLILTPQMPLGRDGRSARRTGAIRPSSTRGCG